MQLILTENASPKRRVLANLRATRKQLAELQELQYEGGFLRFSIDIVDSRGGVSYPTALREFLRNVLGRELREGELKGMVLAADVPYIYLK